MIYNMRRRKKKVSLKWYFNDTVVPVMATSTSKKTFTANFKSANRNYTGIRYMSTLINGKLAISQLLYMYKFNNTVWERERGWLTELYRTVEFEKEPTGELLAFLQANATPL